MSWNMPGHFAIFLGVSSETEWVQTKNSTHHNLLTQRWCKLWTVGLPWLLQMPFWHLDIKRLLQEPVHLNALLSKYKLWFSFLLHIAWKTLAYKLLDKILFVAVTKTFVCCKLRCHSYNLTLLAQLKSKKPRFVLHTLPWRVLGL